MASTVEEAQLATQKVKDEAREALRTICPYLKTEALEKLLADIGNLVDHTLEEQRQVIDNSKSSTGFLSLSAELRNNIYDLALIDIHEDKKKEDRRSDTSRRKYNSIPPLCQVSKQVRAETMPMFFGRHAFKFSGRRRNDTFNFNLITSWLNTLDLRYSWSMKKVILGLAEEVRYSAAGDKLKTKKQEVLDELRWGRFGMRRGALSYSSHY